MNLQKNTCSGVQAIVTSPSCSFVFHNFNVRHQVCPYGSSKPMKPYKEYNINICRVLEVNLEPFVGKKLF